MVTTLVFCVLFVVLFSLVWAANGRSKVKVKVISVEGGIGCGKSRLLRNMAMDECKLFHPFVGTYYHSKLRHALYVIW
jgi:hypothetical protein